MFLLLTLLMGILSNDSISDLDTQHVYRSKLKVMQDLDRHRSRSLLACLTSLQSITMEKSVTLM